MKNAARITLIGLALVAGLAITTGSASAKPRRHHHHMTTATVNTIVIGDSITYYGQPFLQPLKPTWVIDGVPGRDVNTLDDRIKWHLANTGTPHRVIIALGQNISPAWGKADYRAAVNLLPSDTVVYFITTYRDPAIFGQEAADTEEVYSRWMHEIAVERPLTHVIHWRNAVLENPALLMDGSHPTNPEGRTVWANLVVDTVKTFEP